MKPKERVLTALNHEKPDRVPIGLVSGLSSSMTWEFEKKIVKHLNISLLSTFKGPWSVHRIDKKILERFGSDFRTVSSNILKEKIKKTPKATVEEYGIIRKKIGYYYEIVKNPLENATIDDLDKFEWPDPKDSKRIEGVRKRTKKLSKTDYAIVAEPPRGVILGGFLECGNGLRGMQRWMTDLIKNKDFVKVFLDKILDQYLEAYKLYLEEIGDLIDVIAFGDDLGMQTGPIISLKIFRKYFKHCYKKLFQLIKSLTDAKLFFHCCGSIKPFIPELIRCGIDILNPVQVSAKGMGNTAELKKEFGKKLVFWGGGCDTQDILPHGSPADVKKEVKKRIKDLAQGGGYIFSQVHNIQPDVPVKNVIKMFDTALKFGRYPIK